MPRPELEKGARGPEVRELQDLLNRGGALLGLDEAFGPGTERALIAAQEAAGLPPTGVCDQSSWDWLEAQPEPSPEISCEAVTFIVREEVGGRDYYERHASHPHWPGGESGVTIGAGYDLRFSTESKLEADWGEVLSRETIAALRPHLQKRGSRDAANSLDFITVPFSSAWRVLTRTSLPAYIDKTKRVYSTFDALPDLCKGALVSLVYNRGTKLSGGSRREMQAILDHLVAGDHDAVAGEFESMKRLWPDSSGLCERRDKEAALWRRGLRAGV